jgi:hypothetical protein
MPKKESWKNFCSTLTHKTRSKEIWTKIRAIKEKQNKKQYVKVETDGKQTAAETLAKHFAQASSNSNHNQTFLTQRNTLETKYTHLFTDQTAQDTCNTDPTNDLFTINEWDLAIKHKKQTAPGKDALGYSAYQNLPNNMKHRTIELINQIWTSGELPNKWKQALVIPI